eukprot:g1752.t1
MKLQAVEWLGVKNQMEAFLRSGAAGKRVALISTMGTTTPPTSANKVFFYKLLAESYVSSVGVPFSIVKPCGLCDDAGGERHLMAGHDETRKEFFISKDSENWFSEGFYMIPRADVANVTAMAMLHAPADAMRFDLCAKGPASGSSDFQELLQAALLPWQRQQLEGHTDVVKSVDFSACGQMAATASADGTARVWAVPSGKCLQVYRGL